MDNICHTLVGAALAESGLKRRTAMGTATLMIAANLPDIDVIAAPLGHSLAFRRGITHGVLALVILPVVLTLVMLAWSRWRGGGGESPSSGWLLLLSGAGVLTHPFLDWMNSYGMRWLMPMDPSWSYADTLFIVDPWIWLALALGVWWSRRREAHHASVRAASGPARVALIAVSLYIAAMGTLTAHARGRVRDTLTARGIGADMVVVEPVPANPFRRRVIYLRDGSYQLATWRAFRDGDLSAPWLSIPLNAGHAAVAAARRTDAGREYHSWTRLPFYVIESAGDTTWVTMADARYTLDGRSSWAVVRVPVTGVAADAGRHGRMP